MLLLTLIVELTLRMCYTVCWMTVVGGVLDYCVVEEIRQVEK